MSTQFEFRLPDIGEGVSEGEVTEWLVKVGDSVNEDDPMVEVMTDKATVTIGAPRKGTIAKINFKVGEVAKVGQVLVVIDMSGASARTESARAESTPADVPAAEEEEEPKKELAATAVGDIRDGLPGSTFFQTKKKASNGNGSHATDYWNPKPLATPATRKLARDLSIDLRRVRPRHPSGRVTRDDLEAASAGATRASSGAHTRQATPPSARRSPRIEEPVAHVPTKLETRERAPQAEVVRAEPVDAFEHAIEPAARVENTVVGMRSSPSTALEVRKPFVGIRRRIAERMQLSKNTAAHFTFVEECHADKLIELRKRLLPRAEAAGIRLSYLPFIVKAVVAALKKHPVLNSMLDAASNELVYRSYYHVGIATATEQGLVVPVVRDADRKSLLEVARDIEALSEGARTGKLAAQDLSGSTFTITSLGKQGGLFATPVLNYPEVGILGVHQMKERPIVRDGQIVIGNVMLLSLSFDHRIVDGHVGAAFAYDIIRFLEDPEQLFLEMS